MDKQIPKKTKRRTFTVSWIKKARKKLISAPTELQTLDFYEVIVDEAEGHNVIVK